jgi:hypothetical protein
MPEKQDETIYDAEFTEISAEDDPTDTTEDTEKSLVIADTLKPLDPTQDTDGSSRSGTQTLVIISVIVLLVLAALYLRGLQLATL